jgi:glycosyltransferase involved in cell wall biosynthesis
MKEKKILIVYPYNFVKHIHGIDTRYFELAVFLRKRGFKIDLFSIENDTSEWDEDEIAKSQLIDTLFLFDARQYPLKKIKGKAKRTLKEKWDYRFKDGLVPGILTYAAGRLSHMASKMMPPPTPAAGRILELADYAYQPMKEQFNRITSQKRYDYVLIGYVYWANLIHDQNIKNAVKVIDINDFISLQSFYLHDGRIALGAFLEEEIKRIDMFDVALCISDDERMFFSQFAPKPTYYYVPQFFPKRKLVSTAEHRYDILFIGSDNPHNQKSIKWFFDTVQPLLNPKYRLLIVGKITNYVSDYPNVTKIDFADNLDDIYQHISLSICPMLQGTGMKIKVVEALSYGKPVVCTTRGVDGFNQKRKNGCTVADSPMEFASAITRLLTDKAFYEDQRSLAISFFEENFEEKTVGKTLEAIFKVNEEANTDKA